MAILEVVLFEVRGSEADADGKDPDVYAVPFSRCSRRRCWSPRGGKD